jgi:hypothetical protein
MSRIDGTGHRRISRAFQNTSHHVLASLALIAVQRQTTNSRAPFLKPLLLTDGSIALVAVAVGGREGPLCADDGVARRAEEENGPRDDPQEREVEEPAYPFLVPPDVDEMRRVNVYVFLLKRERDVDVAAVVCASDDAFDAVADECLVESGDDAA